MADRSMKVSELPLANTVYANDIFYISRPSTSNSYAVTASTIASLIPGLTYTLTVGPTENNDVATSAGNTNISYLQIDNTLYSGAKVYIDAVEGNNRSQGELFVTARGSNASIAFYGVSVGNNLIYPDATANINSGIITCYFNRQNASTANVTFRYQILNFIL